MAQLQSKVDQLNEKNKEMDGVEGVDIDEYKELQSELNDFSTRWSSVSEDIKEEEKRLDCQLHFLKSQLFFKIN